MTVALVADAHIAGPGGPPEPLLEQLRPLPEEGCRHLVLLGDIFQTWVGLPQFETPEVTAVVAALTRLRQRGVRIDYVEGNRDFFIAEGPYARTFDRVADEVAFSVAGVRYLAVHGDGLDAGDVRYRAWRWLSKSAPTRLLMRGLPRGLAHRLVGSTERRLRTAGFKHKVRIPREVIERYGRRRLAEGHDVVLLGHFHEAHRWPVDGGEVRLLEAWFSSKRIEWMP